MKSTLSKRYEYILNLADHDEKLRNARQHYLELYDPFNRCLSSLPEDIQDLLCDLLTTSQFIDTRLFLLACEHLLSPNDDPQQ